MSGNQWIGIGCRHRMPESDSDSGSDSGSDSDSDSDSVSASNPAPRGVSRALNDALLCHPLALEAADARQVADQGEGVATEERRDLFPRAIKELALEAPRVLG